MLLGHCLTTTVFAMVLLLLFAPQASPELVGNALALRILFSQVFSKIAILPDNPYESGRLQIRSGEDPTKCYDMNLEKNDPNHEETELKFKDCSASVGDKYQQWIWLRPVGDTGFVAIAGENDQCGGEKEDQEGSLYELSGGNKVVNLNEKSCLTESRGQFVLQRAGNFVKFKNKRSGKCLSVEISLLDVVLGEEDPLESNTCTSDSHQNFYLCVPHGKEFQAKKCWP